MSVNWWILGPVLAFELGSGAFLLRGFWKFNQEDHSNSFEARRAALRMTKKSRKDDHYVS